MANDKPDSFQCGPFETARNPNVTQFVEKLNRLREAVDQCRIQPGVGYTLTRSSGGTSLTIKTGLGSSTTPEDLHPFKIKTRQKDKKYQFFIGAGYVGSNSVIAKNQESWVDFEPPSKIYLEAKIVNLKITELEFKTKNHSQALEPVEIDENQIASRITIGFYYDPNDGKNYQLIQNVKTNILVKLKCSDGYPALIMTQEM
jgi:hypothetical protein